MVAKFVALDPANPCHHQAGLSGAMDGYWAGRSRWIMAGDGIFTDVTDVQSITLPLDPCYPKSQ